MLVRVVDFQHPLKMVLRVLWVAAQQLGGSGHPMRHGQRAGITLLLGQPQEFTGKVLAAEDIELDADPEDGQAGELAQAMDAFSDAEKKLHEIEKETKESKDRLEQRLHTLDSALASGEGEGLMALVKEVLEAKDEANKMTRRAAKADAKVKDAVREAEKRGAQFDKEGQEPEDSLPEDQDKKQGDPPLTTKGETEPGTGT